MVEKGFCDICGDDIEVQICCSGRECGCMGMPIDPPICGSKCWNKYLEKRNKLVKGGKAFMDNADNIIKMARSAEKTDTTARILLHRIIRNEKSND